MDQTRFFHHPCHLDDVVRAVNIRPQCRLERRIKRHVSGTIDNDVGVPHYLLGFFLVEPEILIPDIAVDRHDLRLNKILKAVTVLLTLRIECRRSNDRRPKPYLRLIGIPRPHRRINLPDIRKIMQQHRQRDLSHKAGPADKKYLLTLKYFCW